MGRFWRIPAQSLRRNPSVMQCLREPTSNLARTSLATRVWALACRVLRSSRMAKSNDTWSGTIPLMVLEWATIGVGVIMMMAIIMMHC